MKIPLLLEFLAVVIQSRKKKAMEEPELEGLFAVEMMKSSQASKEGSPAPGKLGADLDPEPFDSGVSRGAIYSQNLVRIVKAKDTGVLTIPT